ncbi:MAG: hypothetical protein AB1305_00960 [Candidatus Hadarchaeota archaeon]
MESNRSLNGGDLASLSNKLDQVVLWMLYSRGPMSRYELINSIFSSRGFAPNPKRVENVLETFLNGGLVAKRTEGLVTQFILTQAGKDAGIRAADELKNGAKLVSD